jgi:outer membrane protein assembly factor BamB
MMKYAGIGLTVVLLAGVVTAQDRSRIFTNPAPPPREALDRLNLVMDWRVFVPMDGRRDGFLSIQMQGNQILAQTRSGLVTVIKADTGETVWRTLVGVPYRAYKPLGFNRRSVFVLNGTDLFALDRESGRLQWKFNVPEGVSAAPAADEDLLFLGTATNRIYAFQLPRLDQPPPPPTTPAAPAPAPPAPSSPPGGMDKDNKGTPPPAKDLVPISSARSQTGSLYGGGTNVLPSSINSMSSIREAGRPIPTGPQPIPVWDQYVGHRVELTPLQTTDVIFLPSPDGTSTAYGKSKSRQLYEFTTDGPLVSTAGQYEEEAYVGSGDANLYALNIVTGRPRWRFTAGAPIYRQPRVTEQDVYVVAERKGMARVLRDTGDLVWRNQAADRFLAANPKFVYAADRSGRLLVLDRNRGTTLSTYDVRDFTVYINNELTDRLFLAANNGLIVCLHDRDYKTPVQHHREDLIGEPAVPVAGDEARARELRNKLAEAVTEEGGEPKPLREMLKDLEKRYGLRFLVPERAFKEAGVEPIVDKPVSLPKGEKVPLGNLLKQMLDPVNATYQVVADTILIVPKPKRP